MIVLKRHIYTDKSTIGTLYLDGCAFCDTLELSCRRGDEKGLLAIKPGKYLIKPDPSPRYGKMMWEIFGVPKADGKGFRTGILIHPANKPEQLDGCIAPGVYSPKFPNWISMSRVTYGRLVERLNALQNRFQELYISIDGGRFPDEQDRS